MVFFVSPQVIESIFYMWRATKDNKWRDMGWQMWSAIEKYLRFEGGYSGSHDANQVRDADCDYDLGLRLATAICMHQSPTTSKRFHIRTDIALPARHPSCHCHASLVCHTPLTDHLPTTAFLQVPPPSDDVTQSWFCAETLKYFFLLFSPDEALPLDKWVLNTEAHPLKVQRRGPGGGASVKDRR